jgi:hypothetical protein
MSSCLPLASDTRTALLTCIAGTRNTDVCLRVPSKDSAIPAIKVTVTAEDCTTTITYKDPATGLALVANADYAVTATGEADEVICPKLEFSPATTAAGGGGGGAVTQQVDAWTTTDGSGIIAGAQLIAADPNFLGVLSAFSTAGIADIQSITITARDVTDGLNSTNFVEITLPISGKIRMFDGQTITFSVVKDSDIILFNAYLITAGGNAYANIFGTKRYMV